MGYPDPLLTLVLSAGMWSTYSSTVDARIANSHAIGLSSSMLYSGRLVGASPGFFLPSWCSITKT
jgi:hypothetical protein